MYIMTTCLFAVISLFKNQHIQSSLLHTYNLETAGSFENICIYPPDYTMHKQYDNNMVLNHETLIPYELFSSNMMHTCWSSLGPNVSNAE